MKTIKLSVKDRLLLNSLLPAQGGRIEMMLVKSLSTDLGFSPLEIKEFELRDDHERGRVIGNPMKFRDIEFQISDEQISILKQIPVRLDSEKRITVDLLPLLDKIDAL